MKDNPGGFNNIAIDPGGFNLTPGSIIKVKKDYFVYQKIPGTQSEDFSICYQLLANFYLALLISISITYPLNSCNVGSSFVMIHSSFNFAKWGV